MRKIDFTNVFNRHFKNEDKIIVCQFFKFSSLEQLWALKSIACVDNKVVSVSYSFQSVWMDRERELDLYTK